MAIIIALIDMAKTAIWPAFIYLGLRHYADDLRQLLPRVREFGPAGAKFDPIEQQKAAMLPSPDEPLRPVVGLQRTRHLEQLERALLADTATYAESDRLPAAIAALAVFKSQWLFERLYRLMFGSQLRALQQLSLRQHVSMEEARAFYDSEKQHWPALNPDINFDDWLGFLLRMGLIERVDEDLRISAGGRDFVSYVAVENLPQNLVL